MLKNGQLIKFIPVQEKHNVFIDRQLLSNTIINLLSNASKYSAENKTITIQTQKETEFFNIHILDDGIGIPESEQKHIFERFFRAKNALNINGTGLGLNISKNYVELMNGSISIKSKENEGTSVKLSFPKIN